MAEILVGQACPFAGSQTPPLPENPVPAMAYVPFQQWGPTYESEKGFNAGTIFPDLDKPFYGRRGAPR